MLVVASNWGLSDGSLAPGRGRRAVAWLDAVRTAVLRAGTGGDGRYRPVDEATLVFAGDTFDWLLTEVWGGRDRPWHGGRRGHEARTRAAAAAVAAARPALRVLERWIRHGIPLPAADGRGRPTAAAVAARLRPVLLAGDRDQWLPEFAAGRWSGVDVGEEWSADFLHVRHGHDLDPLAHVAVPAGPALDRAPTLAESLTVDLIVPVAIAARGDPLLWPLVRPAVTALSAARPSGMPARLLAIGRDAAVAERVRTGLESLWRRHVARWRAAARRDVPGCEAEFDAVDAVAAWLDRLEPDSGPPAAVRRLDPPAPSICGSPGPIVAHFAADAPAIACHLADRSWRLRLDPLPGPAAVAIVGSGIAGTAFVDAA